MTPYLVSQFQKSTLSALIRECFGYDFSDIFAKDQVSYLFNYLKALGAKSILLEPKYIDRDFLEDYSRFYVKRFGNDGYVCGRLHFFSCEVDHRNLDKLLLDGSSGDLTSELLQDHYLGFVVIKPLARTFVGKTCLRVSGDLGDGAATKKKISKRYDVNLFGIKLHVSSIAFQEQDKVVAACATTAIWTALHGLPWRDVKDIPSCSEITIAALNYVDGSNNGFPNKELSNKQIQRSLDVEGLRYHPTSLLKESRQWFLNYVTAHIDSGLPLILSGTVYGPKAVDEDDESEAETDSARQSVRLKGGHAITVLGYDSRSDANWLYVHDDRLGPYARAELIDASDLLGESTPEDLLGRWALAFSHRNEHGEWAEPHEILVPDLSIVPAEKKTRLPFQFARGTAMAIEEQIIPWMQRICAFAEMDLEPLTFSIRLTSISQARDGVFDHTVGYEVDEKLTLGKVELHATSSKLERWNGDKLKFLTSPMARLQWEIDFRWGAKPVFKVLLDATDIPLGDAVSAIYIHDLLLAELILGAFEEQKSWPGDVDDEQFYSAFLKALKRRDDDYVSHLNQAYGALRAPKRLEDSEVSATGEGKNPTLKHRFDPQADTLVSLFTDVVADPTYRNLIWAIGRDGSLFVAEDLKIPVKLGHPSMTGLQAARIAGEMWRRGEGLEASWGVNYMSGRYSRDYATPDTYLTNAIRKIASFFPDDRFHKEDPPPVAISPASLPTVA
ncbi:hypothetical protein HP062_16525 [Pseudomonas sp. B14-6]|uniref:hypothetical protein n=1 Tax=Pseudomonas sp. B14-6 TaxID=2738843 RepID=UPI0015985D88|nr:hypothetical protein [Pseudomonas sp. B14-6]QKG67053.1 hypothetical protein HP062_16525 [Pseudomonas sp. B14-6]